jgi:hypothetical protein
MRGFPIYVGSNKAQSPVQLAEAAIAITGEVDMRRHKAGEVVSYALLLDHLGRVHLARPGDELDPEWITTINRKSNPDEIAAQLTEQMG